MHLDCFQHFFTNTDKPTISILFKYLVHLGEHISHKHFRVGSKGIHMLNFGRSNYTFKNWINLYFHKECRPVSLSYTLINMVSSIFLLSSLCCFHVYSWILSRASIPIVNDCFFVCVRAACFYLFSIFLLSFYLFSSWLIIVLCKLNKWIFFFIISVAVIVPSLLLGFIYLFCYLNFLHGKIYQSILYTSWVYVMLKRLHHSKRINSTLILML